MGARVVTLPRRVEPSTNLPQMRELEEEADGLWEEGDVDAAMERWSEIVKHDPARSAARRHLATALMVIGKWEEASRQLNLCLTLSPGSAAITAELGVCYLHIDQVSNALLLLRESLRLEPERRLAAMGLEAFSEEPPAESVNEASRGLLRYDEPERPVSARISDWSKWIDRALESETAEEAAECLFDVLLVSPDCTRALYELGRLHDLTGRTGWASRYYEQAISCDPQAWQPHFNLARLYATDGEYATARPLLERAMLLRPDAFAPCWLLAQIFEVLGDDREALFWLRRAKSLEAANADVEVALARLEHAEELAHLAEAVRLGCDRPEVLFNLGVCLWQAARHSEARVIWERCELPEAVHACAALAFEAGEHAECAQLMDGKPHAGLLALLGRTFAAKGMSERAIECYRAAVEADSACMEAWLNLGEQLDQTGQPFAAEWQAALRLDPLLAKSYFDG